MITQLTLKDRLIEISKELPSIFEEQKDETLKIEFKIAERKVFLSKKTLTYKARVRIDDENKIVKFFETLKEKGLGVSTGASDLSPGYGFKIETYKLKGKEREGYNPIVPGSSFFTYINIYYPSKYGYQTCYYYPPHHVTYK